MNPPPFFILGTGALATLFAARLGARGHEISMLGTWDAGLNALERDGARLIESSGDEIHAPVRSLHAPEAGRATRIALVLVKAWQTERAASQLKECLAEDGVAITLQNGLGNDEILAATLGRERVALGVTTTGASLIAPGLARAGGEGIISLQAHARISEVEAALAGARFTVRIVADAQSLVWGKLVVNAAINPLTALLRVPNGKLLENPSSLHLMKLLAQEVAAVANAQGIKLPFDDPVAAAENVAQKTAANRSSMLQDVERGAQTEIDAICGAVARAGEKFNVPTLINHACWELVRALEI